MSKRQRRLIHRPEGEPHLEELLLCMNELFALLHFTPHPLHLVLVSLPGYHLSIGLQLTLHQ